MALDRSDLGDDSPINRDCPPRFEPLFWENPDQGLLKGSEYKKFETRHTFRLDRLFNRSMVSKVVRETKAIFAEVGPSCATLDQRYKALKDIDEVMMCLTNYWPSRYKVDMFYQTVWRPEPGGNESLSNELHYRTLSALRTRVRHAIDQSQRSSLALSPEAEVPEKRSTPRFLKLPREIIQHVVSFCEPYDWDPEEFAATNTHFYQPNRQGSACIRALRLTCRLLNEIASPFLVRVLTVSIQPHSVNRMMEISQHQAIAAGVRVVRVSLGHFPVQLAKIPTAYTKIVAERLERLDNKPDIDWVRPDVLVVAEAFRESAFVVEQQNGDGSKRPDDVWRSDMGLYHWGDDHDWKMCNTWDALSNPQLDDGSSLLSRLAQIYMRRVQKGFQDYQRLYTGYNDTRAGFSAKVAEAMTRMPHATRLEITDQPPERRLPWQFTEDTTFYPKGWDSGKIWDRPTDSRPHISFALVKNALAQAITNVNIGWQWEDWDDDTIPSHHRSAERAVEVLFELPAQLASLGLNLARVLITVTPPPKLPIGHPSCIPINKQLKSTDKDFARLVKTLKYFQFNMVTSKVTLLERRTNYEIIPQISWLVRQYLSSPALKVIDIDFEAWYRFGNEWRPTIRTDFFLHGESSGWRSLDCVRLEDCQLTTTELRRLLQQKPTQLRFADMLIADDWGEALEILQEWYGSVPGEPRFEFTFCSFFEVNIPEISTWEICQRDSFIKLMKSYIRHEFGSYNPLYNMERAAAGCDVD